MPEQERKAWRNVFDYYIFEGNGEEVDHIPPAARSSLGDPNPETRQRLKAFLAQTLK